MTHGHKKNPTLYSRLEFRGREIFVAVTVSFGYLLLSNLLIGFRTDQLVLTGLCNILYFASAGTRKFLLGFFVFVLFWIIFDSMKAFPNYNFNQVHIKSLYDAELRFFGISMNGKIMTPGEYLQLYRTEWMDVLSGIFYLCWMPLPLAFGAYLFYTDRRQFLQFACTFLLVNLLGFIIYYVYPAAPPWYVKAHGWDFISNTPGDAAGLARFDLLFNVPVFESIYSKSSNVFAAMPSLHAAYPVIVLYFGWRNKMGLMNFVFAGVAVGIGVAAVYTGHHYALDVLFGVICAGAGIVLFNYLLTMNWAHRWFIKYLRTIE